jgi:hypothetical protein
VANSNALTPLRYGCCYEAVLEKDNIMKFVVPVLIALLPSAGLSQSMGAANPAGLVATLQAEGYRASLTTDGGGDPKIESSTSGVNFLIYFYGCTNNTNCQDLQFAAGFDKNEPLSASHMNEWNRTKFVGSAHIDDEGDPHIEMFVPGMAEMSISTLKRALGRWDSALGQFKTHIGWNS